MHMQPATMPKAQAPAQLGVYSTTLPQYQPDAIRPVESQQKRPSVAHQDKSAVAQLQLPELQENLPLKLTIPKMLVHKE